MRCVAPLGYLLVAVVLTGCGTIEPGQDAVCGDGVVSQAEQCDGANLNQESCQNLGFPGGDLVCLSNCLFDTSGCGADSLCGNGQIDPGEDCDGFLLSGFDCGSLGYSAGTLRCRENCFFDKSGCTSENNFPVCGDGKVELGEDCEQSDLNGARCQDFGFLGGTLACSNCQYDTRDCTGTLCGNGTVDAFEECDGTAMAGQTCQGLGYAGGNLTCSQWCMYDRSGCTGNPCGNGTLDSGELCDGYDLGGQTCEGLGYSGGYLSCSAWCAIDESGCTQGNSCPNGVLDAGEQCDGNNLGGQNCISLGYSGGNLFCDSWCQLDASGCTGDTACGNGALDSGEQCDGFNLAGQTCQSQGYDTGSLSCTNTCAFDLSACHNDTDPNQLCGNGQIEGWEECDGDNLGGVTCQSLGYDGGSLVCSDYCHLFIWDCEVSTCGNGVLDPGEECDPYLVIEETCESVGYGSGDLYCSVDLCDLYFGECSQDPCGNGVIDDDDEYCDGADLGGATCQHLGFGSGTLGCGETCTFYDISGCVCENEDSYEPNSLRDQASPVSLPFSESGLTLCRSFDLDWFKVDLQAGASYRFTAGFQHSQGDINLMLFKESDPYVILGQAESETDNETFDFTVPAGQGGAHLLEIRRERLPIIGSETYSLNIVQL